MHGCAVRNAFILEIKHLLPYAITVLGFAFIQRFFLEDASLHLVEEFLFGERTSQLTVVLIVDLALIEGRVALAGEVVYTFLKQLVVKIVIFNLLQENYEGFLESSARLLDINEWLADQ